MEFVAQEDEFFPVIDNPGTSHDIGNDKSQVEDPLHQDKHYEVDPQGFTDIDAQNEEVPKQNGVVQKKKKEARKTPSFNQLHVSSPPKSASKARSTDTTPASAEKKVRKVGLPSESLSRTTKCRIADQEKLEIDRHKNDIRHAKIASHYTPSDSLMKTTQARVADIREWEASKERVNYDDDIWWELRRPAPLSTHHDVGSKLHEPTKAFKQSVRDKHEKKVETRAESPVKEHIKIDPTSPLLKGTFCSISNSWKVGPPVEAEHVPQLATQSSGPQVHSKVFEDTTATLQAKWKPKSPEPVPDTSSRTVKPPSDRLLAYNSAMRAAYKDKLCNTKPAEDPREKGWHLLTISREGIPPLKAVFADSASPPRAQRRSSSASRHQDLDGEVAESDRSASLSQSDSHEIPQGAAELSMASTSTATEVLPSN
jgi:hypothetical protein